MKTSLLVIVGYPSFSDVIFSMLDQGECAEAKRQGEGQKESTREEGERVA